MLYVTTAVALLIGLLVGMLGGGGSVLLVPVLLYLLRLEPKETLLTSQLVMAVTCAVGVTVHAAVGRVQLRTGILFGLAGMLGAYLGGLAAHAIPARLLLLGFASLMLISAVQMLRPRRVPAPSASAAANAGRGLWLGVAVGLPTGFVAGMLGAGGGFLIVPALTLFAGLTMEQAVGTSLLVIAMQSVAGSVGYLQHVHVHASVVAPLATAMALGSVGGGLLSRRMPAQLLRRLFAVLLLSVAAFMLLRNLW